MTYLPESELNRILLTHSKDEWATKVITLCKKKNFKLTEIQFNKLCKSHSNPNYAAYFMVRSGHANLEWAKKVIENDKSGEPSWIVYYVKNGYADSEWAKKVIENDKIGNPSYAAYRMAYNGYADLEWAKKVIETDKTGTPSWAAYLMTRDGYTDKNWYKKVTGEKLQ